MSKLGVLLAEDHAIVRKALRLLLDGEAGIEIIAEAEDGREAVEKAQQLLPDVVLMDVTMPGLNGLEATRQIKRHCPHTRVVILSMHANEEYVLQAIRAGASGYVVKRSLVVELVPAIRAVSKDGHFLSPLISKRAMGEYIRQADPTAPTAPTLERDKDSELTSGETEVLQLIAQGHPNRRIAQVLRISTRTVEAHRARLMDKLDIHSTAGLTRYAIRKGIARLDQGRNNAPEGCTTT